MDAMNITSVEAALILFETAAIKHGEGIECSNSAIANRSHDKLAEIVKFLRESKALPELAVFYTHPNLSVRSWASAFLLPVYEKRSIKVLQEIVKKNSSIHSFDAEMLLKEWRKGNLRNFYTL